MNTDTRTSAGPICPNCGQWQHPDKAKGYHDCLNDCAEKGFAPKVDQSYKRTIPEEKPTYIQGGYVLPIRRECETVGASGKVNVVDARGRIIKSFRSTRLANELVKKLNLKL
jgi:RecJ-like exonuclease